MTKGKSKKEIVLEYHKDHPKMTIKEVAAKLNMPYATVRHALKDKNVTKPKKKTSHATRASEIDDKNLQSSLRHEEVKTFCPKCGKETKSKVIGVEQGRGKSYVKIYGGKCETNKCGTSFSYR